MRGILPYTISEVQALEPLETDVEEAPVAGQQQGEQPSLLDIAVQRMIGQGMPAHQVWLPPLDVPDTLDELMPDLTEDPDLGLVSPRWRNVPGLVVPLGTVDRPREQRRDTMTLNLTGASGHVAVVGGPRSGKSTLLRTIVTSMSLVSTPLESQFFVLDFGGGTFAPLARFPHVAGVATRSEPDVVRRVVAEVQGVVERREAYFREHGIDSIETYRSRRAQGRADDGWGDVFLVVDGWSTLRAEFDDIEMELQQLAGRGLTFGIHIIAASGRWADFRAAMRDVFGSKLELRLGDPLDSEIDRKVAALVPTGRPGRGLVPSKLHFLAALPRVDGDADAGTLGDGVDDLIDRASVAWKGNPGPKLRLLPETVTLDKIREDALRRQLPGEEAAHRHQRARARAGRHRPVGRAAPAGLRRRAVGQERAAAQLPPGGHAHADPQGGADRGRRLPALAAGRGARRVPAQLPHLGHPGDADAQGHRQLPREPHPRPGRHPGPAAQPLVVDRRRGVRGRRRLRPGGHPAVARRCRRSSR